MQSLVNTEQANALPGGRCDMRSYHVIKDRSLITRFHIYVYILLTYLQQVQDLVKFQFLEPHAFYLSSESILSWGMLYGPCLQRAFCQFPRHNAQDHTKSTTCNQTVKI